VQGCTLLNLSHHESERLSRHRKHRWIVLIELDRPPCEALGFNSFLTSIGAPAEGLSLSEA
jgi:hypothetical protein